MPLAIATPQFQQIKNHASREYPRECCGIGISSMGNPNQITKIVECKNVQDEFHREDPSLYPRTSQNAYLIDPKQLLEIHHQIRQQNAMIRLIYHSHIETPAVFSKEDTRQAIWNAEPLYPGASYLILSISKNTNHETNLFTWQAELKGYALDAFSLI